MEQIKVTIVGCGAVVEREYKKALQKLEKRKELAVVGLIDRNLDSAQKLQSTFQRASVYQSIEEGLDLSGSNLAIIASPPAFHAEHSMTALRMAHHVLCEKPMAVSASQCQQMNDAARKEGYILAIGMTRRYYPSFGYLKKMITRGDLGEILSFSYREGISNPKKELNLNIGGPIKAGRE